MSNIFFISDEHFFHKNIIQYCARPFFSVEEMNETLINNFNERVSENDITWHLGDFCFGDKKIVKEYIHKLNGKHNLILGNHDRFKPSDYINCGFQWASRFPVCILDFIWLSHQPMFINGVCGPYFNICGHNHNNTPLFVNDYFTMNISVENTGYKPINLDEIKSIIDTNKYISHL